MRVIYCAFWVATFVGLACTPLWAHDGKACVPGYVISDENINTPFFGTTPGNITLAATVEDKIVWDKQVKCVNQDDPACKEIVIETKPKTEDLETIYYDTKKNQFVFKDGTPVPLESIKPGKNYSIVLPVQK